MSCLASLALVSRLFSSPLRAHPRPSPRPLSTPGLPLRRLGPGRKPPVHPTPSIPRPVVRVVPDDRRLTWPPVTTARSAPRPVSLLGYVVAGSTLLCTPRQEPRRLPIPLPPRTSPGLQWLAVHSPRPPSDLTWSQWIALWFSDLPHHARPRAFLGLRKTSATSSHPAPRRRLSRRISPFRTRPHGARPSASRTREVVLRGALCVTPQPRIWARFRTRRRARDFACLIRAFLRLSSASSASAAASVAGSAVGADTVSPQAVRLLHLQ